MLPPTVDVRVLIITGSGDRLLYPAAISKNCSNIRTQEAGERLNRVMSGALGQLRQLPIPVIAAVNGDAFGGGCEIVAACDLRLADAQARFSFAQVRERLNHRLGWDSSFGAFNWTEPGFRIFCLTGRIFDAEEARQLGLIQRVVSEGGDVLEDCTMNGRPNWLSCPERPSRQPSDLSMPPVICQALNWPNGNGSICWALGYTRSPGSFECICRKTAACLQSALGTESRK